MFIMNFQKKIIIVKLDDSKYTYKNVNGKIITGKVNKYKTLVNWIFKAFNRAIEAGRI